MAIATINSRFAELQAQLDKGWNKAAYVLPPEPRADRSRAAGWPLELTAPAAAFD